MRKTSRFTAMDVFMILKPEIYYFDNPYRTVS